MQSRETANPSKTSQNHTSAPNPFQARIFDVDTPKEPKLQNADSEQVEEASQHPGISLFHVPLYPPGTTPPPHQESLLPSPRFENSSRKYEFLGNPIVSPEPAQTVQLKGNETKSAPVNVEESINSKKGSGEALADNIREPMEEAFGADFGGVKIHADGESDQLNQSLNSRAFATGQDIFFRQGAYNPGSRDGIELLAHELTHVVQQNSGVQRKKQPKENKDIKGIQGIQTKNILGQIPEIPINKDQVSAPKLVETAQNSLPAKNLFGQIPEIPVNKDKVSAPKLVETAPNSLPAKNLFGQIPEIPVNKDKVSAPQLVETAQNSLPAKNLFGQIPEIPVNKDQVSPPQLDEKGSPKTPSEIEQNAEKPATTPQATSPNAKQANPVADVGKGDGSKNEELAPKLPDVEQTTESAPQVGQSADIGEAGGSAATPDLSVGGGGEEGAAVDTGADQELEKATAETEGVQLESSDRTEVMGSLAEVSKGGGEASVGGGGGGGAAIADKPAPPVPDVSQSDPSQALASIGNLPPVQLLGALGGVNSAVGNTVGKQRAELAASPPQMEKPTGAPPKEGAAGDAYGERSYRPNPQAATAKPVEKAPEGQAKPVPQPKAVTLPPAPTIKAVAPAVKGDAEGKLSAGDAEAMKASLRQMPTSDPNLQVKAGTPPPLELTGNADPQQAQEQKAKLEQGVTEAHTQGQQELAQPMGENEIYPQVAPETLKAEGIEGKAAAPEAPAIAGVVGDDGVSIIAQQEHGAEIQSAVAQAQGQMAAKQQEHTAQVAQEKANNQQEIAKLQSDNTAQQSAERSKAQTEVQKQKEDWNKEQTDLVAKSRTKADEEIAKGNKDVEKEQTQAETKASEEITKGNTEAEKARLEGEKEAEKERGKGEKDSGGILGWFADKAKAFFDGIKQAIQKAFEAARTAVKFAIDTAQKLATAVIETARQAIVSVIKRVGDALIALGDVLLSAFPEMRDRFRNAIKATVKAAETAVNALAENLKKEVQTALNLLGKGLDAALGLLEKGYLLAVDIASKAVQGAISAAKAAIDTLGTFAVLIKDIAASPGQWLSNLGAGAKDGVQNHLWGAFQTAVKAWFNDKVEEVLGLGLTVWNVLSQGGIKLEEVGTMAWEGIKSAIPPALIQLLIEKLVMMIIPGAGMIMVIIEGLQAAWGTVGRILQAMEKFVTFLKAVKSGQSGPQFAEMLAAAGVVLIDFVSNWLLKKLGSAASKVAGKVREIAKKIGKKLKKTFKKLKRKLGKVKDKFFGKKGKKDKKQKVSKEEAKQQQIKQRVEKVKRELPPKIHNLLAKNPSKLRVLAQFALWRVAYQLRRLELEGTKDKFKIIAQVNPTIDLGNGWTLKSTDIFRVLDEIAAEYIEDARASQGNASTTQQETQSPFSLDLTHVANPTLNLVPGREYKFGKNENKDPLAYKYEKTFLNWTGIKSPDSNRARAYPELKAKLNGVDVGDIFTKILHKKPIPNLPKEQGDAINELFGLFYAKEPSHPKRNGKYTYEHRRDLVYSVMLSNLMTPEKGKEHLNVSQAIDLHPAAFGGAQAGARSVTSEILDSSSPLPTEGTKARQNRNERYKREKATIKAWFQRHAQDFVFDKEPTLDDVKKFVKQKLQEYLTGSEKTT